MTEEPEIYEPNFIFFKRIFEAFKVQGAAYSEGAELNGEGAGMGKDSKEGIFPAPGSRTRERHSRGFRGICLLSSLMM